MDKSQTKDKAGAWLITAVLVLSVIGATWFLWSDVLEYSIAPRGRRSGKVASVKEVMSGSDGGSAGLETIGEVEMTPVGTAATVEPKYRGGSMTT